MLPVLLLQIRIRIRAVRRVVLEPQPGVSSRALMAEGRTRRLLKELVNQEEPAWPLVQNLISAASVDVQQLPPGDAAGPKALFELQVTTRSPMGAIAYASGGLLVDRGWLRILGASGPRLDDGLLEWNTTVQGVSSPGDAGYLIVAHDAIGGFFAVNGGAFQGATRTIFYFAPDCLEWEATELGYTEFITWAMSGSLSKFYQDSRWPQWQDEVARLDPNRGILFYPPLWAKAEGSIERRSRGAVPIRELRGVQMEMRRQTSSRA